MPASERGLLVGVYRSARGYDCTSGGLSAKVEDFVVVGVVHQTRERGQKPEDVIEEVPRGSRVFTPSDESPAAVLVVSNLKGAPPHLVPMVDYLSGQWTMHGGNKADTSDGRWNDLVRSFQPRLRELNYYAGSTVDIHDRIEGPR